MKQTLAIILIVLGVFSMIIAGMNAHKAPSVSYLMGSYLFGIVLLAVGWKLRQPSQPPGRNEIVENRPRNSEDD
jgi:hypothetical protein